MTENWLLWARQAQALAQSGLTFCTNPYDIERYHALEKLAAEMMAGGPGEGAELLLNSFQAQKGYATPKVDVRAALFRDGEVLLVSENSDGGRWTLPGGFADVNSSPSDNAVREMREEAGLEVKTTKLVGVWDRDKRGYTKPYPYHIYKLMFLCELTGTCEKSNLETGEPQWFPVDALPELSMDRTQPWHIERLYAHYKDPSLPAEFD
ncbi:ADP-ribose pyrophosphatase YjhB (NUDIX family) [Rhizomicrobium palustre]|uniref:ADP-ribose pyrophosphatase YjhB (NUDIX family) n=1 Tax=Rhizomicrobium palustre TaxID=189966 RepID=A0A846N2C9_9PROT|nr:NUDIX hydrolase [Rhizomicrobium palustre]NIK89461.1 ADP-ribose pyrophosphatase YjhB (NUDIX family) [Rhizomicrobium palustre]